MSRHRPLKHGECSEAWFARRVREEREAAEEYRKVGNYAKARWLSTWADAIEGLGRRLYGEGDA